MCRRFVRAHRLPAACRQARTASVEACPVVIVERANGRHTPRAAVRSSSGVAISCRVTRWRPIEAVLRRRRALTYDFLIDTYATERIKVLSVWSEFANDDLAVRPRDG